MPARTLAAVILMSAFSSSRLARGTVAAGPPAHEAYDVRYATLTGFPVASLVPGEEEGRKLDIAIMIWVLKGPDKVVLVDSGFYRPRYMEEWKSIADFTRSDKAVGRLGIKSEDVTDIILTHSHWDHADGADLFPKAQVWIQEDEDEHTPRRPARVTSWIASRRSRSFTRKCASAWLTVTPRRSCRV